MASRGRKSTSRGPSSSSRPATITKRHLRASNDDPSYIKDIRLRNVIVEIPVQISHVERFDIPALLQSVGWGNILRWGGPAYRSIAQSMYACICDFSLENLTFTIATKEGPFVVDRHLISDLMEIPVNDEGIPLHTLSDKPSVSEQNMLTQALCNMDVQWSHRGNALPSKYLLPAYRVLHRIFVSNLYPRSGNKTELTTFMVRILHAISSGVHLCLPSLICFSIIQFRLHPGHSDIPFAYFMTVLASHMFIDMPSNEAPIHHLIFNNTNLNKMKLELLPGQGDGGGRQAEAGNEGGTSDVPDADINMDDIFEELNSDSTNDPDFEPSAFDARLSALEANVDKIHERMENMSVAHDLQFKYMRKYLRRLNKGMHSIDPSIPAPSSSSD